MNNKNNSYFNTSDNNTSDNNKNNKTTNNKIYKESIFKNLIKEERLINTFLDLLKIKSPSLQEKLISEYLIKKFKEFNIVLEEDNTGLKINGNAGNLIGSFQNHLKIDSLVNSIFLMAHMDTVAIKGDLIPVFNNGKFFNKDKKSILGGDDKVAIAAIIEAVNIIIEHSIKTRDLYFIFTVAEEIGVLGAKYLNMKSIKPKFGFVFDGEGDVGTIFNQAPYHNTFEIEVKGKSAHAGAEPEKGINAIKAAANAIARLNPGRVDKDTTYNIGVINGGVATNIVPDNAIIKAEARSLNEEKLNEITANIKNIFIESVTEYGAKINIKSKREYNGFFIEETEPCMQLAVKAINNIGKKPKIISTGGGSDINILNSRGKSAVNLSSGMEKIHSNKEYVKLNQLKNLVLLILELCTVKI